MLAIIGGTSFIESNLFNTAEKFTVDTPYGIVNMYRKGNNIFLPRHGTNNKLPPHKINHRAHLMGLKFAGAKSIISFGSVGSLKSSLKPGTLVLVSDWFAPFRVMTFFDDNIQFTVPGFDQDWRAETQHRLTKKGLEFQNKGVYVETLGPRFETVSEINWLANAGDVVGMTCASEATLANELGIPLSILTMVDNWANGIFETPLTGERFLEQVKENRLLVEKAAAALMD